MKISLEFSISKPIQKSLIDIVTRYLPNELRSNPNIWISNITSDLFNNSYHKFATLELITDDEDLYKTKLKQRSDIINPLNNKQTVQTISSYTSPYDTLPEKINIQNEI